MRTLTLADGRELTYDVYGDPDGTPVVFNHSLSDSRLVRHPDETVTASLGVRMIAADQPGVGGSTRQPGRRMVDWGADMEELVDALGIERFSVLGHSGGAPHALAIPARMPDRVDRVALASPVSPLDEPGMARLLVNKDLKLIARLHHVHQLLRLASASAARRAMRDIPSYVEAMAEDDPTDANVFLGDPARREMFEESFGAGMQQGGEGMYEMIMALWDWGFAPEDVTTHVDLFYGDADDMLDPAMPLHLAERLPDCEVHRWPGAGHYAFVEREHWSDLLGAVA